MEEADWEDEEDIDRKIRAMANDPEMLAEEERITAEFEVADWEAFQLGEKLSRGVPDPPDPFATPRR